MWTSDAPATGCMCLFCVWDVGCATANQRSRFNQLTSCSVQFSSPLLCITSWQDNFRFQLFQIAMPNELPGDESCQKKLHTKVSWKIIIQKSFCALYIQCRAPSMWRAVPASSVLGTFLSPMAECTMSTRQLETSHQQRTSYFKLCIMPMELLSGTSFGCNYRV